MDIDFLRQHDIRKIKPEYYIRQHSEDEFEVHGKLDLFGTTVLFYCDHCPNNVFKVSFERISIRFKTRSECEKVIEKFIRDDKIVVAEYGILVGDFGPQSERYPIN